VILLAPCKEENDEINFSSIATPLWLTCPFLNDKIHILQSKGFIKKMEELLHDEYFSEKMEEAHIHYAILRKNIYKRFFLNL
jgi:hypothetical protein